MTKKNKSMSALRAAFPHTVPVLAGYLFLGITYGILMRTTGFPWWYPTMTALVIYTGSMEFLMTSILLSSFNPLSAFCTALMVGARHLFYGISLLGRYQNLGPKKFYLIYTTSDETFSVIYTTPVPPGVDRGNFYLAISFLDQMYWVAGATLGGIAGGFITFNIRGLDFVMTAMFVVILLSQWEKDGTHLRTILKDHVPELTGILGSAAALAVFGPDRFIIPAMVLILACLMLFRKYLDPGEIPEGRKERESEEILPKSQEDRESEEVLPKNIIADNAKETASSPAAENPNQKGDAS